MQRFIYMVLILGLCHCSGNATKVDPPLEARVDKEEKQEAPIANATENNDEKLAVLGKAEEKKEEPKKIEPPIETEDRQPGSLWSARSHWNNIFSLNTFRRVGDTLLVQPTESFRNRLSRLVAEARKDDRGTAQFEERNFVLTLREVEAGGTFKVSGSYNFLFAGEPVGVEIQGKVREREIKEDDSLSSDGLLDASLQVASGMKSSQTEKKGDKEEEKATGANTATVTGTKQEKGQEKSKVVETVKDPGSDAAKRKRKAIQSFEKQKNGTRVAKTEDSEESREQD